MTFLIQLSPLSLTLLIVSVVVAIVFYVLYDFAEHPYWENDDPEFKHWAEKYNLLTKEEIEKKDGH